MDTLIENDHDHDHHAPRPARTRQRSIRWIGMGSGVLLGLSVPMGMAGCNTTAGVGEDIEAAGDAIEDTAEDAQD